jgi:hypothetical protein
MMPPLPTLAMSRELLGWLREDPQWAALDWRLRAALAWKARWGTINARLSEVQTSSTSAPPRPLSPLLILGPWRSGTTVMHELLTAATGLPTPLTWQCMNACAFRLTGADRARRSTVLIARPMDGLALSAESPQEDEFALLALGLPSAYRAFLMPHRIMEMLPMLDAGFWLRNPQWLRPWESFMQAVLAGSGSADNRLILKSPNHSFRVQAILQRFPQTKVVWMLRDPLDIFHSNRKMWRAMFVEHGLTTYDPDSLDAYLSKALLASADALRWAASTIGSEQFVSCSQQALRQQPEVELARVLQVLRLTDKLKPAALHRAIELTRVGKTEIYSGTVPASAVEAVSALREAQAFAVGVRA